MPLRSAGLLVYRQHGREIEVLLAHPGGPFFAKRDLGVWSIPKGEYDESEPPEAAAEREFAEEIGLVAPAGTRIDLGEVRQASGKLVRAFAVAGELDLTDSISNHFEMEWPPGSGRYGRFPEVDRAQWFPLAEARRRLNPAQAVLLDRLAAVVAGAPADGSRIEEVEAKN
jgi:predicted NUDIX family NTP pyrophosphohydrolase